MAKSDNTGMILLGVAAVAGYYAYTQGWFSSLFGSTAALATTPTTPTTPVATAVALPVSTPVGTVTKAPPSALMAALQAAASNPGNMALSSSGGATYSGYQWDAIAKSALGSSYIPLSSLPAIAGGTQYSLSQYLTAYPNGGMSGLGRTVIYLPHRGVRMVLPANYHMRRA